jgi:molecular chaperone DnaJ
MAQANHYQTLNVRPTATQAEIKQAYRQLVKRFHPDVCQERDGHDRIANINAAYEVLGDYQRRKSYDQYLVWKAKAPKADVSDSEQSYWHRSQARTATAQQHYQQRRSTERDADAELQQWLRQVYSPVNRLLREILAPLEQEINRLAADPFDDELMGDFQTYLEDCRSWLAQAQRYFSAVPNPASVAGVAAHLYYCLNHIGDGLDELETFTLNYDDHYLHMGQELFRITRGLLIDAHVAIKSIPLL